MPPGDLSLQNFTSIFEIFAGYYLLLGTSKKFHDYFNIVSVYKSWRQHNHDLSDQVRKLTTALSGTNISTSPDLSDEENEALVRQGAKAYKKLASDKRKTLKLLKYEQKWDAQVTQHYDSNDKLESIFYRFMKPFYIFFGSLAFSILLIGGFNNHWIKINNLNVLNLLAIVLLLFVLISVVANKFFSARLIICPPQYSFIAALFCLPVVLFTPSTTVARWQFIPSSWMPGDISFANLQIFVAVLLMFVPIVIHLSCVLILMVEYNIMKRKFDKLTMPRLIPSVSSPPDIPKFDDTETWL